MYGSIYLMVCTGCEEWPKEKRSEIMFLFFVSDMHSRKLQHRLNEKLWLGENFLRTHGTWRNIGPSHIGQCSQNPSKSIDIGLSLTASTCPTSPLHHPHITTMSCPLLPQRPLETNVCMQRHMLEGQSYWHVLVSWVNCFILCKEKSENCWRESEV